MKNSQKTKPYLIQLFHRIVSLLRSKLSYAGIVVGFLAVSTLSQFPKIDSQPTVSTSGEVHIIKKQPDGKILIGGWFYSVGRKAHVKITRLNSDGTVDEGFNPGSAIGSGANSKVYCLAIQPDGKILVGGTFTTYNGISSNGLVRLHSNGALDRTFNVSDSVTSIAIQSDGKILVGGNFNQLLIRFLSDGSLDTSFSSHTGGGGGSVLSIIPMPDGTIYIGGSFSRWRNGTTQGVVKLRNDGIAEPSFNFGSGIAGGGKLILQSDGRLLIYGSFNFANGTPRNNICRINPDGTLDTAFPSAGNPPGMADRSINAMVLEPDGKMVIGGSFVVIGSTVVNYIARLNVDGSLDTTYAAGNGFDEYVYTLESDASGVLVGGRFTSFNNTPRFAFARLESSGVLDTSYDAGFGVTTGIGAIKELSDGRVLVGGEFTMVNGRSRKAYAVVLPGGELDPTFIQDPQISSTRVESIQTQSDGKILLGGIFTLSPGGSRILIRLLPNGTLDSNFNPPLLGDSIARIVPSNDGKLVILGRFSISNSPIANIARLHVDGTIDSGFNPGTGFDFYTSNAAIQGDGKIVVVGGFSSFNGVNRRFIARLNNDGSLDPDYVVTNNAASGIVGIGIQQDGRILLAGSFSTVNGVNRRGIVRLNLDGSVDLTFNSPITGSGGANHILVRRNGKIVAGGTIAVSYRTHLRSIIHLNEDGTENRSIDPIMIGSPSCLENGNFDKILVGGTFNLGRLVVSDNSRFASVTLSQYSLPFDLDYDGRMDFSVFRPNGLGSEWWWLNSSNGGNAAVVFGASTDTIVPADYTGDGKTDVAFWRPSTGFWYVLRSEDQTFYGFPFGSNGDVPVPADYDADGKADSAVFRESAVTWFINKSGGGTDIIPFGAAGDKPVQGDFDGDGKGDLAVFRPNGGTGTEWWVRRSSNGVTFALQFGTPTDKAVPGDYTGDGKADIAFWRPSNGNWFVLRSENNSFFAFPFGIATDTPVPGDYDGDGRNDAGVFRSSNNTWYINRTTAGTLIQQFGATGDLPLPNAYVR